MVQHPEFAYRSFLFVIMPYGGQTQSEQMEVFLALHHDGESWCDKV